MTATPGRPLYVSEDASRLRNVGAVLTTLARCLRSRKALAYLATTSSVVPVTFLDNDEYDE